MTNWSVPSFRIQKGASLIVLILQKLLSHQTFGFYIRNLLVQYRINQLWQPMYHRNHEFLNFFVKRTIFCPRIGGNHWSSCSSNKGHFFYYFIFILRPFISHFKSLVRNTYHVEAKATPNKLRIRAPSWSETVFTILRFSVESEGVLIKVSVLFVLIKFFIFFQLALQIWSHFLIGRVLMKINSQCKQSVSISNHLLVSCCFFGVK